MTFLDLVKLIGGLAMFLYGMNLARNGLQQAAGNKLRHLLGNLTRNRFSGVGLGAVVTFLLQSSSATTVILVGLTSAGMMSFAGTVGVILGADIGTTLTVQLLSLKVANYALLGVFFGFVMTQTSRKYTVRYYGETLMGFGFIFYGMMVMGEATYPLRDLPWFVELLGKMGDQPLLGLVIATVFTAVIQSSAATIGIVLSMAHGGGMELATAISLILGANIGTCATAMLATVGASIPGKRVAWAHIWIKVLGVVLFLPFIDPFASLVVKISGDDMGRQIANAHTLFNIILAVAFVPFTSQIAKLVVWFVKEKEVEGAFRPMHLDRRSLETPALALGNVDREILRMADIVQQLLVRSIKPFETNDLNLVGELVDEDQKVDMLNKQCKLYLTGISRKNLTQEQVHREYELLEFAADLEVIGDILTKNLMYHAQKKVRKGYEFSEEGNEEIRQMHQRTVDHFRLAMAVFTTRDATLANQCIDQKRELRGFAIKLRHQHIRRLHAAVPQTIETTSLHMDLLDEYARVNSVITRMAYRLLNSEDD